MTTTNVRPTMYRAKMFIVMCYVYPYFRRML